MLQKIAACPQNGRESGEFLEIQQKSPNVRQLRDVNNSGAQAAAQAEKMRGNQDFVSKSREKKTTVTCDELRQRKGENG